MRKTESASNTNPSETEEEAVEEEAVEEDALREVNVVLDWYPNAIHAFLYTAIERGYFKEEGKRICTSSPSSLKYPLSIAV